MPMSKRFFGNYILCPYYDGEEPQKIHCCEDPEVKGMGIIRTFDTHDNLRDYRHSHCEQRNSDCPIAQGLNKKWGYEDGQ